MGDALGDDEVLKVKRLLKSKAGILDSSAILSP